jgi:hypothetical protein
MTIVGSHFDGDFLGGQRISHIILKQEYFSYVANNKNKLLIRGNLI